MPDAQAIVLLNAAAGSYTEALAAALRARFAAHGWHVDLAVDETGAGMATHADEAVAAGYRVVVAGGGDGTLSTVAGRLLGTGVALGVLPVGTRNHFAKAIGMPLGWEDAIGAIATGTPHPVDVAEVNGRPFLNNASVGLYPRFVRERGDCPHGGLHGMLLRTAALGRAIACQPAFDACPAVAGEVTTLRTRAILVSNGPYGFGGLSLARRAGVAAGTLGFYVVPGESRLALARAIWAAERGTPGPALLVREAPAGTFDVPEATAIALDGECVPMAGPFAFRSLPGALPVMLPHAPMRVV